MFEYDDPYFSEMSKFEHIDHRPQYFQPPPRTRANYSGYNSIGNVTSRNNRAATIQDVEQYYYGGEEKEVIPCRHQHLEYEIRELRMQHKYMMFFIFFVILIIIFGGPRPALWNNEKDTKKV